MSDAKSGGLVEWLLKKRNGGDDNDTGSEGGGGGYDDDDDGSGGIKLPWVLLTVGGVGLFAKWMYDQLGAGKAGKAAVSPAPAPEAVAAAVVPAPAPPDMPAREAVAAQVVPAPAPPDRPATQVDQAAVAAADTPPLPVEAVQPDAIAPQIVDNWASSPGRQKTILRFVCPKMVTNFAIFAMSLDKMVLVCNYLVLQQKLPDTVIMDCFFTFFDVVGTFISKEKRENTVLDITTDVSCVIMRNALRNGVMGSGPYNTVCNYLTSWFMFRRKLFNKETTIQILSADYSTLYARSDKIAAFVLCLLGVFGDPMTMASFAKNAVFGQAAGNPTLSTRSAFYVSSAMQTKPRSSSKGPTLKMDALQNPTDWNTSMLAEPIGGEGKGTGFSTSAAVNRYFTAKAKNTPQRPGSTSQTQHPPIITETSEHPLEKPVVDQAFDKNVLPARAAFRVTGAKTTKPYPSSGGRTSQPDPLQNAMTLDTSRSLDGPVKDKVFSTAAPDRKFRTASAKETPKRQSSTSKTQMRPRVTEETSNSSFPKAELVFEPKVDQGSGETYFFHHLADYLRLHADKIIPNHFVWLILEASNPDGFFGSAEDNGEKVDDTNKQKSDAKAEKVKNNVVMDLFILFGGAGLATRGLSGYLQ